MPSPAWRAARGKSTKARGFASAQTTTKKGTATAAQHNMKCITVSGGRPVSGGEISLGEQTASHTVAGEQKLLSSRLDWFDIREGYGGS